MRLLLVFLMMTASAATAMAEEVVSDGAAWPALLKNNAGLDIDKHIYFGFPLGAEREAVLQKIGPPSRILLIAMKKYYFYGPNIALVFQKDKLTEVIAGSALIGGDVFRPGSVVNRIMKTIRIKKTCGRAWTLSGGLGEGATYAAVRAVLRDLPPEPKERCILQRNRADIILCFPASIPGTFENGEIKFGPEQHLLEKVHIIATAENSPKLEQHAELERPVHLPPP